MKKQKINTVYSNWSPKAIQGLLSAFKFVYWIKVHVNMQEYQRVKSIFTLKGNQIKSIKFI